VSDRNSVWQTLWQIVQSNPFWFVVVALLYQQPFRPWVAKTVSASRNALARLLALCTVLLRACVEFYRRHATRPKPTIAWISGHGISTSIGYAELTVLPEPLPPGTASALAMAMQPPPQRPHFNQVPYFVNNSNWAQIEAVQRQQEQAGYFAMTATMPRFNPALLSAAN
jgi:hypothetical protein